MPAFRQVGEKQLPNPILYMAWSPKRDLIALANTSGEVGFTLSILEVQTVLVIKRGVQMSNVPYDQVPVVKVRLH